MSCKIYIISHRMSLQEDALLYSKKITRLYQNAMRNMPEDERRARASPAGVMHGQMPCGTNTGRRTTSPDLDGSHSHDAELALMLPNIFVTTLPDILSGGSSFFCHAKTDCPSDTAPPAVFVPILRARGKTGCSISSQNNEPCLLRASRLKFMTVKDGERVRLYLRL